MTSDTLLHRQIHPKFAPNGEVTSQAFRPTEDHAWKLSVYDGDQMIAEKSWTHYTSVQGNHSCGVLSVVVSECEALQLPVHASPEAFPEHCDIDFANLTVKIVERKGKLLRDKAVTRGWQYKPEAHVGDLSGISE
jgi:hypothetical protein